MPSGWSARGACWARPPGRTRPGWRCVGCAPCPSACVLHPALPSCPGHALFARDFRGATGLFSVVLAGGDEAAAARLIDRLTLFGIGYSWGGFESLAVPARFTRTATMPAFEGPLIRLHVGLEDPDDLIADLEPALADYPD